MGRKILLIEDDSTTGSFIARGLDEHGFLVDRANNGRDGLFLATDGSYDAIVLDRMLPQMDGMAVLSALRAAEIETPVIILSALGTADDRIDGLNAGCDDYLVKPFAFAELLARLRLMLRKSGSGTRTVTELACGDLEMDLLTRQVRRAGRRHRIGLAAAVGGVLAGMAHVGQHGEGGIDHARAGRIGAGGQVLDGADQVIAVARLVGQQLEQHQAQFGGLEHAPAAPPALLAAPAAMAEEAAGTAPAAEMVMVGPVMAEVVGMSEQFLLLGLF